MIQGSAPYIRGLENILVPVGRGGAGAGNGLVLLPHPLKTESRITISSEDKFFNTKISKEESYYQRSD